MKTILIYTLLAAAQVFSMTLIRKGLYHLPHIDTDQRDGNDHHTLFLIAFVTGRIGIPSHRLCPDWHLFYQRFVIPETIPAVDTL